MMEYIHFGINEKSYEVRVASCALRPAHRRELPERDRGRRDLWGLRFSPAIVV